KQLLLCYLVQMNSLRILGSSRISNGDIVRQYRLHQKRFKNIHDTSKQCFEYSIDKLFCGIELDVDK
ncbi:MAG: hypothetical protein RI573_07690, partial [Balneolaceae bacterium]|nr:hypothetical protein [Balneolaceae bacterium]